MLSGCLTYIEQVRGNLLHALSDSTAPHSSGFTRATADRSLGILSYVEELLKSSNHGEDAEPLKHALLYIESLPVSDDSWLKPQSISFHRYMRTEKYISRLFSKEEKLLPLLDQEAIDNGLREALGKLHATLMAKIAWTYSYPVNISGEIINPSTKIFKCKNTGPSQKSCALQEYQRDIKIDSKRCRPGEEEVIEQDVDRAIDLLLSKSSYTESERSAIKAYIKTHGQEMNRFLDLFINHNHFYGEKVTIDPEEPLDNARGVIGHMSRKMQNWTLQQNGMVCFEYICGVKSIRMQEGTIMYSHPTRSGRFGLYSEEGDEYEPYQQRDNNGLRPHMPTLMSCAARVELRVISGEVYPCLIRCDVTSFTNILQSPRRLQLHDACTQEGLFKENSYRSKYYAKIREMANPIPRPSFNA